MLKDICSITLDNGLEVICLSLKSAPVVAVHVWYRTGSAYESEGIRGISHFLEHMMFRGSRRFAPEEHARRINEVGGRCNALTSEDVTAFLNAVPREHLRMVLEMEADRMTFLNIDPVVLETERSVLIEEYQGYMNNPLSHAFLEFRKEFFGSHPYGWTPLGVVDDLKKISLEDCLCFYRRHYSPANAVMVIIGDIPEPTIVFKMVHECFEESGESIRSKSINITIPAFEPSKKVPRRMVRSVDFDVPLLIVGFPAPPAGGDDVLELEMLQLILAHGESSWLYRNLVRDSSIAFMAGGMNHFFKRGGMSFFYASFSPDTNVRRVERDLIEQIVKAYEGKIETSEIDKVRNVTATHRVLEMYSCEQLCQRIGYSHTVGGDYRLWLKRLEHIERITGEQLQESARRWWSDDHRHVLYLKPQHIPLALYLMGIFRRLWPK